MHFHFLDIMAYTWTAEANLLLTHQWVDYASFIKIISSFKYRSFSVKAMRDFMRTTLENFPCAIPFAIHKRFPESTIYIDLHHSVPLRILRQLTMALDFSDRQMEKGRNQADSIDARVYSNLEDAKVAFYSAVDQLLDLVGPLAIEDAHIFGVYIRSTFESEHTLGWN